MELRRPARNACCRITLQCANVNLKNRAAFKHEGRLIGVNRWGEVMCSEKLKFSKGRATKRLRAKSIDQGIQAFFGNYKDDGIVVNLDFYALLHVSRGANKDAIYRSYER